MLRLRQEKDELLDVVWLATSGTEIRQLWQKVVELLGDEQTQLQIDALAIELAADNRRVEVWSSRRAQELGERLRSRPAPAPPVIA